MQRGSLGTLILGIFGLIGGATTAHAEPRHSNTQPARPPRAHVTRAHIDGLAFARAAFEVRAPLLDATKLAQDDETRGRRHFGYLAWLPFAVDRSNELDPRPVLRQVFGRQLVREDGFNLFMLRGKHFFVAEMGRTQLGIAPTSFSSPGEGTIFTIAAAF